MSQNTISSQKHSEHFTSAYTSYNEDKGKHYKDEFRSLFPPNRKSFTLPSHNYNICEIYKSRCDKEIKISEIVPVRNIIYTEAMEKLSIIYLIKPVKRGNENMLMMI